MSQKAAHLCVYRCMSLIGLKLKGGSNVECSCRLLQAQKKTDLKALLAEHTSSKEGQLILWNQQNFTIHQVALYLHSMPNGETKDLLLFVVPKAH